MNRAASSAMHCAGCGHDNPAASRYCNQCGQPLNARGQPYTPKHLADKILVRRAALEGERKQVTVLFIDVKNSVALSRKLNVETWHHVIDRFFAILGDAIHTQEGTVNQYTGDGVMALFGAPLAHEDHAQRACIAALSIQQSLREFAAELAREHGIEFAARTGLNSGEVVVGRIGDDLRMDYTAKGQTVGLAARMEQMAPPGRIYLSEFTARLLQGRFELRRRGEERVKGIDTRLGVHELRGLAHYRNRFDRLREEGRLTPFINRKAELALLDTAVQQAHQGHGSVVILRGHNGMGKSRLAYEIAQRTRNDGMPVYEIHALHQHRGALLAPFLGFVRDYLELTDDMSTAEQRVRVGRQLQRVGMQAQLEAVMQLLQIAATEEHNELRSAPGELFALLRAGVAAGAMQFPGMLIVENLQLLDTSPEVVAFVDDIVHYVADSHSLLVVTVMAGYQPRWQGEHIQLVDLQPLPAEQSTQLAQQLLGKATGEEQQLVQWLAERGGGNPLFMEETLGALFESGVLVRGRKGIRQQHSLDDVRLPAEIQAMIAARIDQLEEPLKRLLQVAAVAGRQVQLTTLADVLQAPANRLRKQLETLVQDGWFYQDNNGSYSFHQALVREVAYSALLQERNQQLHLQVAQSLAQRAEHSEPELAPLIAQHYTQANALTQAVQWHIHAAQWARQRDLGVALQHWLRVVELADQCSEAAGMPGQALAAIAQAIYIGTHSGLSEAQHQALVEQGDALCEQVSERHLVDEYRLARVNDLLASDQIQQGLMLAQVALEQAADDLHRVAAHVRLAHVQLLRCNLEQTQLHCRQGLALCGGDIHYASPLLGRSAYVDLQVMQARATGVGGQWQAAAKAMGQLHKKAGEWPFHDQHALLLLVESQTQFEVGHRSKARQLADWALQLAQQSGNVMLALSVRVMQLRLALFAGELELAQSVLEKALQGAKTVEGYSGELVTLFALQAQLLCLQGKVPEAHDTARKAAKLAQAGEVPLAQVEAHLARALTVGLKKRRIYGSTAEDELEAAAQLLKLHAAQGLDWRIAYTRGLMYQLCGEDEAAGTALSRACEQLVQQGLRKAARLLQLPQL